MVKPIAAEKTRASRNDPSGTAVVVRSPERGHNLPIATELPAGVMAIGVAAYAGLIGSFWIAFGGDGYTTLVLIVVSLFALMYFGLPWLMNRTATRHSAGKRRPQSVSDFLAGDFDTLNGRISGWSAFVQYAFLPVALAFGGLAIGIIMMSLR